MTISEVSLMDLPMISPSNSGDAKIDNNALSNLLGSKGDEDFDFEEATLEVKTDSYLNRIINDFDQRKNYEEIVLKILNFYQRSPQKHP